MLNLRPLYILKSLLGHNVSENTLLTVQCAEIKTPQPLFKPGSTNC